MYLYIRMFFVMLVSLYTVRIVIRVLGITDYGIFNAVGGIVLIMSFLSHTITYAAQRYFSFEIGRSDANRLRIVFNTTLFIYIILAVCIAIIVEFAGLWFLENKMLIPDERMVAAHWVLHFSLLSFIVSIVYTPFVAIVISHERMDVYACISIVDVLLKLGVVYLLVFISTDKLILYAFLLFVSSLLVAVFYILYCYSRFQETHLLYKLNRSLLSELVKYSSWAMFGSLAGAANTQGVNLLFNTFFGPNVNASQSVAIHVGNALQLFSTSIFTAIRPPMTKDYAKGNYNDVMSLFYKSSRFSYFLLFMVLLPLYVELPFILKIWIGNVDEYMVSFSRMMLIYIVILAVSNPITIIAQAANKVKLYHGVVDSFTLLTLVISYFVLLCGFTAEKVYWVMIAIMLVAHVIRLEIMRKIVPFSYIEYVKCFILRAVFVSIISAIPVLLLYNSLEENIISCLVIIVSSLTWTALSVLLFGIGVDERKTVIQKVVSITKGQVL